MSETNEKALKPCPFCGKAAQIMDGSRCSAFWVHCPDADGDCHGAFVGHRPTLEEAIEAWNRRAPKESRKLKEAMELLKGAEYFVRNFSGVTGPGKPYGDKCLCKYGHESCEFHRRYEALRNEQDKESER